MCMRRMGRTGFNPFQGIQVLSGGIPHNPQKKPACFNPFQGIQVLSENFSAIFSCYTNIVSIPFREFKCCRVYDPFQKAEPVGVSIPFREFKCCRYSGSPGYTQAPSTVSIPFREFKCCRILDTTYPPLCA